MTCIGGSGFRKSLKTSGLGWLFELLAAVNVRLALCLKLGVKVHIFTAFVPVVIGFVGVVVSQVIFARVPAARLVIGMKFRFGGVVVNGAATAAGGIFAHNQFPMVKG
jgi:hypothetical protein